MTNLEKSSELDAESLVTIDNKIKELVKKQEFELGRKNLWISHHWPEDYDQRCIKIGNRYVCRRCGALYPLSILVAILCISGFPLWSNAIDPYMIWAMAIPATIAYAGEALGFFKYSPKFQVSTTLLAACAFGKGLSYELTERWSSEFWHSLYIFGAIWLLATIFKKPKIKV